MNRDLFKWASGIYTSRGFSSRSVHPQDTKYWTAYNQAPTGRQTVLLDFSHVPPGWKDFSVLFPGIDLANHKASARVDWAYDPGRFTLSSVDAIDAGSQIYNNYGPKSNAELLMGYGFCLEDNEHDEILLTLKPPPDPLLSWLRILHAGYFDRDGGWNSKAATFKLQPHKDIRAQPSTENYWLWEYRDLTHILYHVVRFERGHDPSPTELAGPCARDIEPPADYMPFIAIHLTKALAQRMSKILQHQAALPDQPNNTKQAHAKIYREGQLRMLQLLQDDLRALLHSFRPSENTDNDRSTFLTLEETLDICKEEVPDLVKYFIAGQKHFTGTSKIRKVVGSEHEQNVWALLIMHMFIFCLHNSIEEVPAPSIRRWMQSLRNQYGDPVLQLQQDQEGMFAEGARQAAMFLPGSLWASPKWMDNSLAEWTMRVVDCQSTTLHLEDEDARFVMYLSI